MTNDILGLYGPEDSKYLRLVARRAAEKGIKTAWVDGPTPGCVAYVADTDAGWPMWDLSHEEDVDNIKHPGLSCCAAEALMHTNSVPGWTVCIIGRGHAVQGLADAMMELGYMVNQCSSTALDMRYRAARAELIVNSAPAVDESVLWTIAPRTAVIDIDGGMGRLRGRIGYVSREDIGAQNIAELLRRVKEQIRKERDADGRKEGCGADGV